MRRVVLPSLHAFYKAFYVHKLEARCFFAFGVFGNQIIKILDSFYKGPNFLCKPLAAQHALISFYYADENFQIALCRFTDRTFFFRCLNYSFHRFPQRYAQFLGNRIDCLNRTSADPPARSVYDS